MKKNNANIQMRQLLSEYKPHNPLKLLLHVCCAPCGSACFERLSEYEGIKYQAYFYNPNILGRVEYDKRLSELKRYLGEKHSEVDIISEAYNHEEFYSWAYPLRECPEKGERCHKCYEQRLRATAIKALLLSMDAFATTLTLSPLKDAGAINDIGMRLQRELGIMYLPSDFKKEEGYRRSIELSKECGLYRQDFCGCEFSVKTPDRE